MKKSIIILLILFLFTIICCIDNNTNIVTKNGFTMYLDDSKLLTLNKEMEFPVIINDYEGSINMAPILTEYSWPINIRAVLVDADTPDVPITMASAVFTHDTDKTEQEQITAIQEYEDLLVQYNEIGDDASDNHAYLVVNDDSIADLTDYVEPAI